jgi:hypothetical protein
MTFNPSDADADGTETSVDVLGIDGTSTSIPSSSPSFCFFLSVNDEEDDEEDDKEDDEKDDELLLLFTFKSVDVDSDGTETSVDVLGTDGTGANRADGVDRTGADRADETASVFPFHDDKKDEPDIFSTSTPISTFFFRRKK